LAVKRKSYSNSDSDSHWRRGSWKGAAVQRGLEHGRRTDIVRSRYHEKSSDDTASWRRLSVCCIELKSVEISDSVIVTCS
jgi:hypothetical protein